MIIEGFDEFHCKIIPVICEDTIDETIEKFLKPVERSLISKLLVRGFNPLPDGDKYLINSLRRKAYLHYKASLPKKENHEQHQ